MFVKPQAYGVTPDRDDLSQTLLINTLHKHLNLQQQRQLLPVFQHKAKILYCLEKYSAIVLVGETGSGKTTQITQYLVDGGWTAGGRKVVCTQSRRMAAITVAGRVAEEMGVTLGNEVGYAVRFDQKVSARTRIKYCTDGLLLRETLTDPLLSAYSVIIVDEAHERSLYSDILLGLLKKIMKKRKDLRVIVTSATVDSTLFKDFFELNLTPSGEEIDHEKDNAVILQMQGRLHAVDILYLDTPCQNYIQKAVDTVLDIHKNEDWGDILVFLPGK